MQPGSDWISVVDQRQLKKRRRNLVCSALSGRTAKFESCHHFNSYINDTVWE
jgi:hypothetical protein